MLILLLYQPSALDFIIGPLPFIKLCNPIAVVTYCITVYHDMQIGTNLLTVLYFQGASSGPWVQSEFVAASVGIAVWYSAYIARSRLLTTA